MILYYSETDNELEYQNPRDRGADIKATKVDIIWVGNEPVLMYDTGIRVYSEEQIDIQLRSRSSIGTKTNLFLTNGIGTIDGGYVGKLKFCFSLRGFQMPFDTMIISCLLDEENGTIQVMYSYPADGTEEHDYSAYFQIYKIGDRIGQVVFGHQGQTQIQKITKEEFDLLTQEVSRSEGGFGSTGK